MSARGLDSHLIVRSLPACACTWFNRLAISRQRSHHALASLRCVPAPPQCFRERQVIGAIPSPFALVAQKIGSTERLWEEIACGRWSGWFLNETPAARGRWPRRLAAGLNSDGAFYFALLLLVWGLTVPMRGMWQDDTLLLRLAREFQGHGFMAALTPVVAPLRRLYSLPFRLALATPQPIWTLHLIYGVTWLGQALAAGWISRLLMPGRRLTQFLAICLTLTATSDYLTNNLTSLGYNLSALMLLLAVGCSLRYLTGGGAGWIAVACAATAVSIWTIDVAIPALPFVPLLLFWRGGTEACRRILLVLSALGLTLAPAAQVEWRFLHDPTGYAAVALLPMRLAERVDRMASLWCENFAPWRWAFARPIWYPRPPRAIPLWAMGLAAGVAAAWFAFRAGRAQNPDRPDRTTRTLLLAGIFAAMA